MMSQIQDFDKIRDDFDRIRKRMHIVAIIVAIIAIATYGVFVAIALYNLPTNKDVAPATFEGPTFTDGDIAATLDKYGGLLVFEGEGIVKNAYEWVGNHEDVRTIVFRKGITSIGEHSFEYPFFPHLERIVFLEDVAEIGNNAFSKHIDLKAVEFWGGSVKIGENAFKDCANLKTAVPYGSEVAESAFAGTSVEP